LGEDAEVPRVTDVAVLVALAALLFALPFLPGLVELRRPRDNSPLEIDRRFTRNPRYFGEAFRAKLSPFLLDLGSERPCTMRIELRRPERLVVHDTLFLADGAKETSIMVALSDAELGRGSRMADTWVRGDAALGAGARVRALACDGRVVLGNDCVIDRWIDAEELLVVGRGCSLGVSASCGGELRLGPRCTFARLWGNPIAFVEPDSAPLDVSGGAAPIHIDEPSRRRERDPAMPRTGIALEDAVLWTSERLSLPRGSRLERDVVSASEVHVSWASVIAGSIKAHGPIVLEAGVIIRGNLVARGDVRIGADSKVLGNIFAEGDIHIEGGARIGHRGGAKTVYAAGAMILAPNVAVRGWLVAERGGRVSDGGYRP
jgi:predicted acyltransferase (DUF342 family)